MSDENKIKNLKLSNEESNRFTCECLKTAMLHLIAQKSFDTISVSELVKEAGVSRNSFYRNYGTTDALLEALCDELLTNVSDFIKSIEQYNDKKDWYADIFRIVLDKQNDFHILLGIKIPLSFFAERIDLVKILPVSISKPTYENISVAGSFIFILYHWFTNGMKESPEEMAEVCSRIFR